MPEDDEGKRVDAVNGTVNSANGAGARSSGTVSVRLSTAERARLESDARQAGKRFSELLRERLLVPSPLSPASPASAPAEATELAALRAEMKALSDQVMVTERLDAIEVALVLLCQTVRRLDTNLYNLGVLAARAIAAEETPGQFDRKRWVARCLKAEEPGEPTP